ncbi:MAG: hypothetical protein ABR537_13950 [Gemmatimonadales bacterium]
MFTRLVRQGSRAQVLLWLLVGAGCSGGTDPHIAPCTAAGAAVALAVNEYVSLDPAPDSGCTVYPATAGSGAEYLIVPQIATGTPGATAAFRLVGDTIVPVPSAPTPQLRAQQSPAEQFHTFLRLGDERRSWGLLPASAAGPGPFASRASGPLAMNQLRTFQVCAKLDCTRFDRVGARVQAVKSKVAIFLDTLAPAGGFDSLAFDSVANLFETRLYAIDTAAFGRESDIDSNSVVLVLMSNTVNKLVTKSACTTTGYVAGFFFGLDLDPTFHNDSRSNKGEVFYSIVPDPSATLSCAHSKTEVLTFVPVTFIHEFQHMISFNQHVLQRGGNGEVLWLNEGFSHYAEELGGRSYETAPGGRITNVTLLSTPGRFYAGDLLDGYTYLDSTSTHFLLPTAGIGTLSERGAAWLFVRYLVDRYAAGNTRADWDVLTRALVGTSQTGAQNITTVTGDPFATIVSRWALANWATDISGAPPELKYDSWDLHAVYASLNSQDGQDFPNPYPLVPTSSAGRGVNLSGTLRAGSGIYHRATQPASDPGFTLHFTPASGGLFSASLVPRLNVMRLQ